MTTKPSWRINNILRWREKNSDLYKQKRLAGVRNSQKIKIAARKNCLARIAVWRFRSPQNVVYEFKNLSEFLRTHSHLFKIEDLNCPSTSKVCRAYTGLFYLKPYRTDGSPKRKILGSWKGWRWYASKDMEEIG
jgi:hypothetical protein